MRPLSALIEALMSPLGLLMLAMACFVCAMALEMRDQPPAEMYLTFR